MRETRRHVKRPLQEDLTVRRVKSLRREITNELTNARKKELGHPRSIKAEINGRFSPGDPEEQLVYLCLYERGIKSVITTWRGFSWRGTCYRHMRCDKQTRKRGFFCRRSIFSRRLRRRQLVPSASPLLVSFFGCRPINSFTSARIRLPKTP